MCLVLHFWKLLQVHFENRFQAYTDFQEGKNFVYLKMKRLSAKYDGLKDNLVSYNRLLFASEDAEETMHKISIRSEAPGYANECMRILTEMQGTTNARA